MLVCKTGEGKIDTEAMLAGPYYYDCRNRFSRYMTLCLSFLTESVLFIKKLFALTTETIRETIAEKDNYLPCDLSTEQKVASGNFLARLQNKRKFFKKIL